MKVKEPIEQLKQFDLESRVNIFNMETMESYKITGVSLFDEDEKQSRENFLSNNFEPDEYSGLVKATYYYDSMGTLHVWKGHINPNKAEGEADFILTDEQEIARFLDVSTIKFVEVGEWDNIMVNQDYFE